MVYKWAFPTPASPKLACIDWRYSKRKISLTEAEPLTTALYRTCKAIQAECPTLESMLRTGAIIPTVTFDCYEEKRCWTGKWPSETTLKRVLYPASRLRLRCDQFCKGGRWLHVRAYEQSEEARWLLETFLGACLPSPSNSRCIEADEDSTQSDMAGDSDVQDHFSMTTYSRERKKILEISGYFRYDSFDREYQLSVLALLDVVSEKDLFQNLDAIRLSGRPIYNPILMKRLNEQAAEWLTEVKKL